MDVTIVPDPIWSPPAEELHPDTSAWPGICGRCSQTVSPSPADKWCWTRRCWRGLLGRTVHLEERSPQFTQVKSWCSWLWDSFCCVPPFSFSFSISSCRCRISSQMHCSTVFLPKPKLRKVVKAKRRCFFHLSPLLMNRPSRHKHAAEKVLTLKGN